MTGNSLSRHWTPLLLLLQWKPTRTTFASAWESKKMRDIRDDLAERLQRIEQERTRLTAALRALEIQEAAVKALLAAEDRRLGGDALPLGDETAIPETATSPTSVFRRFALACLSNGQEWSLSQIRKAAVERGIATFSADKSIGRSLHAALLGLKQQGLVVAPVPGHWRLVRHQSGGGSGGTGSSFAPGGSGGTGGSGGSESSFAPGGTGDSLGRRLVKETLGQSSPKCVPIAALWVPDPDRGRFRPSAPDLDGPQAAEWGL